MSSVLNLDFALEYDTIYANASISGVNVYSIDIPKRDCENQSTCKAFWKAIDTLQNLGYKIQNCLYEFVDSEKASPGFCASIKYSGKLMIKEECESIIQQAFPNAFPSININGGI